MKIEFEVFECSEYGDTYGGTLYTKEELLEKIEKWIDEEDVEEDDSPAPIYNVLNAIKIKKVGVEE